jgi:hypothetical protein
MAKEVKEAEIVGKNPQKSYEKGKSSKKPANEGQKYRGQHRGQDPLKVLKISKNTVILWTILILAIILAIIIFLIKLLVWLLPAIIIIVIILLIINYIRRK